VAGANFRARPQSHKISEKNREQPLPVFLCSLYGANEKPAPYIRVEFRATQTPLLGTAVFARYALGHEYGRAKQRAKNENVQNKMVGVLNQKRLLGGEYAVGALRGEIVVVTRYFRGIEVFGVLDESPKQQNSRQKPFAEFFALDIEKDRGEEYRPKYRVDRLVDKSGEHQNRAPQLKAGDAERKPDKEQRDKNQACFFETGIYKTSIKAFLQRATTQAAGNFIVGFMFERF
jgi:hypothetical protein